MPPNNGMNPTAGMGALKLVELIEADIYRDGGSYGASFIADDDREYGLWLER